MVVGDTVHLVGEVHGKGDAVQAFVANDASKAARVIGLSHCLEDLVHGVGGESVSALQLLMTAAPPNLIQVPALLPPLCNPGGPRSLKNGCRNPEKRFREHPDQCFSALAAYQDHTGRFLSPSVPGSHPEYSPQSLVMTQPWYFLLFFPGDLLGCQGGEPPSQTNSSLQKRKLSFN